MAFPDPVNVTTTIGLFQYGNTVTNDIFMVSIVLVFWMVLFITLKLRWDTMASLNGATFPVMILSMLLRGGDLVSDAFVATIVISWLVIFFLSVFSRESAQ